MCKLWSLYYHTYRNILLILENATDSDLKDLSSEIKILIHMGTHPNIINFLGACTRGLGIHILAILEYCENGNLQTFLKQYVEKFDPDAYETKGYFADEIISHFELLTIIVQILRGMVFLHSEKVRSHKTSIY